MTPKQTTQALSLVLHTGDIFAAPDHAVLIHACNTLGSWGAGIAAAFKASYPNAFKVYHTHCVSSAESIQTGTCLLIEPCEEESAPKHWVACLFTSAKYGRHKDTPEEILEHTRLAVTDLFEQLRNAESSGLVLGGIRMCKINSGKFGVEWERTEMVLKEVKFEVEKGYREVIEIWDREADLS